MGPMMTVATTVTRKSLAAGARGVGCSYRPQRTAAIATYEQRRTFISGLWSKLRGSKGPSAPPAGKVRRRPLLLEQDNLFHVLSESPIPEMRQRAERIKTMAPCPVNLRQGRRVLVNYDCPDCGWPTHYSEKEWAEDEERGKYLHRLREANEDEHDLRSGREMTEFKLPGPQPDDEAINFSSWDVFFYTRGFPSIETERARRHVSKLLTFPTTVTGVLHENSPYTTRNRRMTREGTRSFLALRQLLHPPLGAKQSLDSVRVFIVGARAESTLPTSVWDQLRHTFPNVHLHLYLIGPEVVLPNWNPLPLAPPGVKKSSDATKPGTISPAKASPSTSKPASASSAAEESQAHTALGRNEGGRKYKSRPSSYGPQAPSKTFVISEALTMTYIRSNYEQVHHQLEPFDPYTDVFFAFSPGFGFPSQRAYDKPKSEEEGEVESKAEPSSETPPPPAPEPRRTKTHVETLDPIAADIESQGEIQDNGTMKPATKPAAATATSSSSSSPSPPSASDPPGTSYSTLPTLPPLLQAQSEWALALTQMLSTKCPIVITGFSPADVKRDVEAFETVEGIKGEFEWLITPGENTFGSQTWAIADFDPRVAVKANWGIWAVRGKRYDLAGPAAYVNLNPFRESDDDAHASVEVGNAEKPIHL